MNDYKHNGGMPLRVLITQSSLSRIGGSEVQAYELASYLKKQGYKVTVYSWFSDLPMQKFIENIGVRVITSGTVESQGLSISDFDLVWVQHEVLPLSFIRQLASHPNRHPYFIFSHMSPYQEVHLEHPYIYNLEEELADLVVFNAQCTLDAQEKYFRSTDRFELFPNPGPDAFAAMPYRRRDELRKLLIVSNHAPEELISAVDVLRALGITVDVLQDVIGGGAALASPSLLDNYDCVVTIGKTVQYCLLQGIPVFVYDRFGGPGYLADSNFNTTAYFNFSGRMKDSSPSLVSALAQHAGARPSGRNLAQQITSTFRSAVDFQDRNRQKFISYYSLSYVWKRLADRLFLQPPRIVDWDDAYVNYILSQMQMVTDYVRSSSNVAFYQQPVQIFLSATDEINSADLAYEVPLHENFNDTIKCADARSCRIDFGDSPCLVTDLTVVASKEAATKVEIGSSTPIMDFSSFLFLASDPQIYIKSDDGLGNLRVSAHIYPLTDMPVQQTNSILHEIDEYERTTQEELDRWRADRRNPLIHAALRVVADVRKINGK